MTETYSLNKDDEATLSGHIRLGASWDVSSRGEGGLIGKLSRYVGADLDALAILMQDNQPVLMAGLDVTDPLDNASVVHSGDNQTGKGDGDDETIDFHLDRIDSDIESIILVVSAFKKTNKNMGDAGFGGANKVQFRFYDMATSQTEPQFRIRPSLLGNENTCLLGRLDRKGPGGEWTLRKINQMVHVKHGDRTALLRSAMNA